MSIKVFVLGRPGSGKTTAVQYMQELAKREKHALERIKDYDILRKMYLDDIKLKTGNFRSAACDGFDILNYAMFDVALQKLEEYVRVESIKHHEIVTIEFARNDYREALDNFTAEFLQGSYFLFLNAKLDTCKSRILGRITHPPRPDHHFVSDYIMDNYYYQDNWEYISHTFSKRPQYKDRVTMFQNTGELSDLYAVVEEFYKKMVAKEKLPSVESLSEQKRDIKEIDRQPVSGIKASLPV